MRKLWLRQKLFMQIRCNDAICCFSELIPFPMIVTVVGPDVLHLYQTAVGSHQWTRWFFCCIDDVQPEKTSFTRPSLSPLPGLFIYLITNWQEQ